MRLKPGVCLLSLAMIALLLLYCLFLFSRNSVQHALVPPTKEYGPVGLYSLDDKVEILTERNFGKSVYNSTSSRLIQFYNSWCGHCIKFSPIWKKFGADVYNWRNVTFVSSINCADDENTQLCRDYEIMGYPTIRFFTPSVSSEKDLGVDFDRSTDVTILRHQLVDLLLNVSTRGAPKNWPNLLPTNVTKLQDLWNRTNTTKPFIVLVLEDVNSYVGTELILDLKDERDLSIFRTHDPALISQVVNGSHSLPLISLIYRNLSTIEFVTVKDNTRGDFYEGLLMYLNKHGFQIYGLLHPEMAAGANTTGSASVSKDIQQRDILTNRVYQMDLETALRYSLYHEIPLKFNISGDSRVALLDYLDILIDFFPIKHSGKQFLRKLKLDVAIPSEMSGHDFEKAAHNAEQIYDPVFSTSRNWFACKGSTPTYRGYPCGLWLTFHTLTVHAHDVNGTRVPNVIANYLKHYFGCSECTGHFLQMAKTIRTNVSSLDDGILWFWRAHNEANRRLHGDDSEDPSFPKVQFPLQTSCPACYHPNGTWNEPQVLLYLKTMYSNINTVMPDIVPPDSMKSSHQFANRQDGGNNGWNLNVNEINICLGVYILSICILVAYMVNVFSKKRPRMKPGGRESFSIV